MGGVPPAMVTIDKKRGPAGRAGGALEFLRDVGRRGFWEPAAPSSSAESLAAPGSPVIT